MDFIQYEAKHEKFKLIIKQDLPGVGWYLYVYKSGVCIFDSLQDDLEKVKKVAESRFGCKPEYWSRLK